MGRAPGVDGREQAIDGCPDLAEFGETTYEQGNRRLRGWGAARRSDIIFREL